MRRMIKPPFNHFVNTVLVLLVTCCFLCEDMYSQAVSITGDGSPPHASAMLDVQSSSKGFLVPSLSSLQRLSIVDPADGLLVWDKSEGRFYLYDAILFKWMAISSHGLLQDEDSDTKVQVERFPDDDMIRFDIGGTELMRLDSSTLQLFTPGFNTYVGELAGMNTIADTAEMLNAFFGAAAGHDNTTGRYNTFIGGGAGFANTIGERNTFIGREAGEDNTGGERNTFVGNRAGQDNIMASDNTFIGNRAGDNHETGGKNTFVGAEAGLLGTTGDRNIFLGYRAGQNENGSDRLYIHNSDTSAPLIYGEFDEHLIGLNGWAGVQTNEPLTELHVHSSTGRNPQFLLTPQTTSANDSSTIFMAEDHDASFGMYWLYDGDNNFMKLFGKSNSTVYGPHMSIQRNSGDVGFGTGTPQGTMEIRRDDDISLILNRVSNIHESRIKFYESDGVNWEIGQEASNSSALIFGSSLEPYVMYMREGGDMGINTISPNARLHVSDDLDGSAFTVTNAGFMVMQTLPNRGVGIGSSLETYVPDNGLFVDGDVNIGRANYSGFKLSVDGKVACEEVLVELSDNWPDYVFEEHYSLMPLSELHDFIRTQGHLPGMPDAAEVEETGLVIGEMQRRMMEKIEELTLYILDQEERIAQLEAQLESINENK